MAEKELVDDEEVQELADFLQEQVANDDHEVSRKQTISGRQTISLYLETSLPDLPWKRRSSPKRDYSLKGEAQGLSAVDS